MINVIIPLAGKQQFFTESEYIYPKPLIEINGKTMIEYVIKNLNEIKEEKQFIFIVNSDDVKNYHMDNIFKLLTDDNCKIVEVKKETKGAACSVLMGIEYIYNDSELIIANPDQLFDNILGNVMNSLRGYDASILSFNSIHPRWSYARLDESGNIIETAEKRPISKNAIAGLFYFRKGSDFVESAMNMIRKDANVNGSYYVAPTLNEMVLKNKMLNIVKIDNESYHIFSSPQTIKEYENFLKA